MIYHITSTEAWQQAQKQGEYQAISLEIEGFIGKMGLKPRHS
jgi:uncharacterized protein (DUF952 family)